MSISVLFHLKLYLHFEMSFREFCLKETITGIFMGIAT